MCWGASVSWCFYVHEFVIEVQMTLVLKLDCIYVVQRAFPPLLSAVLQQMGVTGGESVCITNLILSGRHHSHTLTYSRPNEILPLCPCHSSSICLSVCVSVYVYVRACMRACVCGF